MKRSYFKQFFVVIVGIFLSVGFSYALPSSVHAQQPLVVCGTSGSLGVGQDDATGCQACHLFQLIDRLIRFLILIAIPVASLLFAYAGFLYFTANGGHNVDEAKGIFADVLIGFIIALCGYLIVDTILRTLASGEFAGPSWHTISCGNRQLSTIVGNGLTFNDLPRNTANGLVIPTSAPGSIEGSVSEGTLSDLRARTMLQVAGVAVNESNTTLNNIRLDTVNQVINLKEACECEFKFTGGTEGGHAPGETSHAAGYKADISTNPALDSYIRTAFTTMPDRSDGSAQYRDQYGNIYAREGNHWDILVNKGTGPLPRRSS